MIKLFAPAKINYYLHILDKRDDGYYNLESLMGFLDVGDEIEIHDAKEFSYSVSGEFSEYVPKDIEDDLIVRAARLFCEATNKQLDVSIKVKKNLPSGAGLGGGSSDAAVVIKGLNELFGTRLSESELSNIGLELGSELPVCIRQRLSNVSGRGEILNDADEMEHLPMVVIWPDVFCSTAKIFSNFKHVANRAENDLLETAYMVYPEIKQCTSILKAQYGVKKVQMNGSGSSCFAMFDNIENAEMARDIISQQKPKWWVRQTNHYS